MGQRRYFKGGQNRPALCRLRKLGKIKLRRLFQIGQGLLEGLALGVVPVSGLCATSQSLSASGYMTAVKSRVFFRVFIA